MIVADAHIEHIRNELQSHVNHIKGLQVRMGTIDGVEDMQNSLEAALGTITACRETLERLEGILKVLTGT